MGSASYISFRLGNEILGIPLARVREIVQPERLTKVPGTPPSVRGVISVRGSAVPLLDLSLKFHGKETELTGFSCVALFEVPGDGEVVPMGVLFDRVNELLELSPEAIGAVPEFGTPVRMEYLAGMAHTHQGFMLLLDVDRVLSPDELAATAAATPASAPAGSSAATDG